MRPSAKEVMEDKFDHLKSLKKKVKRSKTLYVPVLSLVKNKKHQIYTSQKEEASVLINHLVLGPPALFPIECPVCKDILKVPHQTECCGKIFCQTCIQKTKKAREGCPTCNQHNYNTFPDRGLLVALQQLQTHCPNVEDGCKWKGFLKDVDRHLNYSPSVGKILEGCQYVSIQCPHCCSNLPRSKMKTHQLIQCPRRPFTCQFCSSYTSFFNDVQENHWPVCQNFMIQCEYRCGELVPRKNYKNHVEYKCMEAIVMCTYVDCDTNLARKNMLAHVIDTHTPPELRKSIQQASQLQIEAVQRKYDSRIQHYRIPEVNSQKFQLLVNKGQKENQSLTKDKDNTVFPVTTQRYMYTKNLPKQPTINSLIQPPQEPFLNLIECPVCLQIVVEPYQMTCCGRNICKECITASNQKCPNCRQVVTNSFCNKGLQHVLSDLYIHCPNKMHSCEWKGRLCDLNSHLNPVSEHSCNGCKYAEVKCQDCGSTYARHLHAEHKTNLCQMRLFTCTFCNNHESTYDDVTLNHWHVCSKYLLRCPRKCGTIVERQNLTNHLSYHCSLRQKHFCLRTWCKWAILISFLCILSCLLWSSLTVVNVFTMIHPTQEIAVDNQEWSQVCQEWIFSDLIIRISFSKTHFKGINLIEFELQDINQEWADEFEFGTAKKVLNSDDMHKLWENIGLVFESIPALERLQVAIHKFGIGVSVSQHYDQDPK